MALIQINMDDEIKDKLAIEAKKLDMPLTTYCRMMLIKSLNNTGENKE